jgi:hypothetical protein
VPWLAFVGVADYVLSLAGGLADLAPLLERLPPPIPSGVFRADW